MYKVVFLIVLLGMALFPKPYGYFISALSFILWRRIELVAFRLRYLTTSLAPYITVFLLDLYLIGPPKWAPVWWEAVVLAPFAEELIFRALPFAVLPPAAAWTFAVAVFGVLHFENPLIATAYGLSLTLAYRGGGYLASFLLHSLNNAVWILLATGGF